MKSSRLGKADSVFKRTEPKPSSRVKFPVGRSATSIPSGGTGMVPGTSVANKLTVILPPDQVNFLDRLAMEIRSKTGKKMKRTEIIRALVAALMGSGIDLSTYRTEEDIAGAIQERLER